MFPVKSLFPVNGLSGRAAVVVSLVFPALACDRPLEPDAPESVAASPFHGSDAAVVQQCTVLDQETEAVIPGVSLTWTSSFLCADAPDQGSYRFTVTVENAATSTEAIRIDALALRHTSPRPGGAGPAATADADGLPLTVAPGGSGSFEVSGTYSLVDTDEGKKANIHLSASGAGEASGLPFELGINAHIRGAGAVENGEGNNASDSRGPPEGAGPPTGTPGRP